MRFISIVIAAALLPSSAHAQVFDCKILKHWQNSAMNGQLLPDNVDVSSTNNTLRIDLQYGEIRTGKFPPIIGKPVYVAGASSFGLLTGGTKELAVHTIFPNITLPDGSALGSIMRIVDNDYMPKGTLMTQLSCKKV